jgi:hypothetical protein
MKAGFRLCKSREVIRHFCKSARRYEAWVLVVMEEFFHVGPPLALLARFERFLAGLAGGPPFLHARVGRYQRHVGIEVVSDILEVTTVRL